MNILKAKRRKKGFTLVELIVVIVILGLLIGIAVPRYNQISAKAKTTADEATARTIISAIHLAAADHDGDVGKVTATDVSKLVSVQVEKTHNPSGNNWGFTYDSTNKVIKIFHKRQQIMSK
ncbi:MAG: hypothetical protein CSB19_00645 [Clostridiales bacterium]|nr:MAG: hypothetical protein CSB19_00645 [Clostridiales bacterium]